MRDMEDMDDMRDMRDMGNQGGIEGGRGAVSCERCNGERRGEGCGAHGGLWRSMGREPGKAESTKHKQCLAGWWRYSLVNGQRTPSAPISPPRRVKRGTADAVAREDTRWA